MCCSMPLGAARFLHFVSFRFGLCICSTLFSSLARWILYLSYHFFFSSFNASRTRILTSVHMHIEQCTLNIIDFYLCFSKKYNKSWTKVKTSHFVRIGCVSVFNLCTEFMYTLARLCFSISIPYSYSIGFLWCIFLRIDWPLKYFWVHC